MQNENLTVKQIYRSKNVNLLSEASTLMFNVQTMGKISGLIYTYETIEGKTLEELRDIQNELIPLYNEALKQKNN